METEADFKLLDNKHKNINIEYETFISELYTIVYNAKNFYKSYNPHQSEKIFKINKNELKSFLKKYEKILNECKTSNHLIPYDLKKEYYNFEKYRLDFCEKDKKIFKYFNKICDILI